MNVLSERVTQVPLLFFPLPIDPHRSLASRFQTAAFIKCSISLSSPFASRRSPFFLLFSSTLIIFHRSRQFEFHLFPPEICISVQFLYNIFYYQFLCFSFPLKVDQDRWEVDSNVVLESHSLSPFQYFHLSDRFLVGSCSWEAIKNLQKEDRRFKILENFTLNNSLSIDRVRNSNRF